MTIEYSKQVLLKRGNTTVSTTYIGPLSELTYDTGLKAIRVHDGVTPGGILMPTGAQAANVANVDSFIGNVTVLQSDVTTLYANAIAQQTSINGLLAKPDSSSGPTPPSNPVAGSIWYDTVSGRIYVYYDSSWVDASPETLYNLPIAGANSLGGIKVGDNLSIDGGGVLRATVTSLGNLTINDQTISGTNINGDITLVPNGIGTVLVSSLSLPTGSILAETAAGIEVIVADLLLDTVVDYSTGEGDNIPQNTYGTHNQINHPWAVYRFTTTPSPALEIEDVIAGAAIPVGSTIIVVGTGASANIVVTDRTITGPVPQFAAVISIARPITNATMAITTNANVDISLNAGLGGRVLTSSHIIPLTNNEYDLGTPTKRFRRLWLGGGSIYVQDETTGGDVRITAIDGNFVVAGAAGLEVGEFRFVDNELTIIDPTRTIEIGQSNATGEIHFRQTINVRDSTDEYNLFRVNPQGDITILANIATDPTQSAMSIVGARTRDVQSPNNLGVLLQLTGSSTAPSRIYHDSYGAANYSAFIGRKARGNSLTPSQVMANDIISRIGANPYKETAFSDISTMRMDFVAKEDQTNSAQGNEIQFWSTAIGSSIIGKRVSIDSTGIVLTALANGGITFADGSRQITAANITVINGNITALESNVSTLFSNAASQSGDIATLFANAASQSGDIATLFANAAVQSGLLSTLTSNAAVQSGDIATLFANAAVQSGLLSTLTSNAAVQSGDIATLFANAVSQQTQINSAVTTINAGTLINVSRTNGTVGINSTGVANVFGTTDQVIVNDAGNKNLTLSLPQSISANSNPTFNNLTVSNLTVNGTFTTTTNASINGKILFLANNSTSNTQISGGGIVLGNIQQDYAVSFLYDLNSDVWDTNGAGLTTLQLRATDANFSGNVFSNGAAHFGASAMTIDYPNAEVQIDSDTNSYAQLVHQNHNSGTEASADFVAVNDIGDDSTHYIDMGINSSGYNNPLYSITKPNDGYLYVNGGNLVIGTQTAGNVINFFTGNTISENLRATINDSGLTIVGNISADNLNVTTITGNVNYANIINAPTNLSYFTNDTNYANTTYVTTTVNTANLDMKGYVDAQDTAITNAWTANAAVQHGQIISVNGNIATANTNMKGYVDAQDTAITNAWTANTGALATNISILQSNVSTLFSNAASQAGDIATLFANAGVQSGEIISVNGNIATANTNMKGYVDSANTIQSNQIVTLLNSIAGANSAIITANTNMKGYVDAQDTAITNAWTANAAVQSGEIISVNGNIATANTNMKGYVDAQISTTTSAITTANINMKGYVDAANTIQSNQINNILANIGGTGVTSIDGGNNIVLSGSTGNVTITRIDGLQSIVTSNTAATANLTTTNQYFGTTRSATGTGTITLPLGSTVPVGRQYIIKDEGGQSGNVFRRITVAASGSDTIDGSATRSITSNFGSLTVLWTGTKWSVI